MAGDDRAEPVLGYGDRPLDPASIPCNMSTLLSRYSSQMEWLQAHPEARVSRRAVNSTTIVEPLLTCTWSQGAPYNDLCPLYKGKRCATGCIATAMAQVMYYWHYPSELPDLGDYITRNYHIYVPELPGTTLAWEDMCDGYSMPYTPAQGMAVATLMRYCGQASSMDYTPEGSGSGGWNQMSGLLLFGYDQGVEQYHRDDYEAADWLALMLDDLTQDRPILYTGLDIDTGHAYVVDGYDGSLFHINWGWEGYYDGYFALDAFDVAGMSFSYDQSMLHGVCPSGNFPVYDIDVDGVCYKLDHNGATVTTRERRYGSYSGRIVIPDEVTSQGVTYPVTAIANSAFKNCTSLTAVTLPSTLKRIGKYAFKNCTSLTSVAVPDGVEVIGDFAFLNCTGLTALTLGRRLEEIGYFACFGCSSIRSLAMPSSMKRIGDGAFMYCSRISRLTTGNGVEEIGDMAFASCPSLREVVLGDNLKFIGGETFLNCRSLEDVTIGESVDSIGPGAFSGCPSVRFLKMRTEAPPVVFDEECFDAGCYTSTTLVVPSFSYDDYYCCDVWKLFSRLVCFEDLAVTGDVNGDGEVNIADVNALIDAILVGTAVDRADINGDGEVNIADVNALIDLILTS